MIQQSLHVCVKFCQYAISMKKNLYYLQRRNKNELIEMKEDILLQFL